MIIGGFRTISNSVRSLKKHEKEVSLQQDCRVQAEVDMPVIFSEADTKNVSMPHNDSLVIELKIEDCDVTQVLVDTGSSVDLIFLETLRKMDIGDDKIKPSMKPLTALMG